MIIGAGWLLWTVGALGCRPNGEKLEFQSERVATMTVNVLRIAEVEEAETKEIFFGQLTPQRESRLAFRTGGKVKSIQNIASRVPAGELLAELDQPELEQQKTQLEAQLDELRQDRPSNAPPSGRPSTPTARPAAPGAAPTQPPPGEPQIAALERQLRNLESQLEMGRIVAPFDAIVAETYVDTSAMAPPSSPAIRIVEDAAPRIKVALPRTIADRLQPNQPVQVRVDEQTVDCRVNTIAIEERPVGSRFVWLQTEQPWDEGSWSFGQTVETSFTMSTSQGSEAGAPRESSSANRPGFWLPQSALTRAANGLWSVYVVAEPAESDSSVGEFTLARKIVEVIQLQDDWALVQGDLRRAEMVVANGPHRVVPGQAVRIEDVSDNFLAPGSEGAAE